MERFRVTRRIGILGLLLALLMAWMGIPAMAKAEGERPWRPLDEGIYAMAPDADPALALRVDGTNVLLAGANRKIEQTWQLTYDDDGSAVLTSLVFGRELSADGDRVFVADGSAAASSRWHLDVQDDGTFCLVSAENGRCLDIRGGIAPGASLGMSSASGSVSQRFTFEKADPIPDGAYRLDLGTNTGLVVGVDGGSTSDGAPLTGVRPGSGLDQRWLAHREDDGTYTFEALCSGLLLTATEGSEGAGFTQAPRGSSTLQGFFLEPAGGGLFTLRLKGSDLVLGLVSGEGGSHLQLAAPDAGAVTGVRFTAAPLFESGYYRVAPLADTAKTLDVSGGSVAQGANVQLWDANDSYAQTFEVTMYGNDECEFGLCEINRVVAPRGGSAGLFANVEQCERTGGFSQRWKIAYEGGRGFSFTNVASGLQMGVAGGSLSAGANIELQMPKNDYLQRFTLVKSSYKEPPIYYGFQNPAGFYQVSNESVWFPHVGEGTFGYRTESRIGKAATKDDCLNAMIGRAHEYLGTPYVWDYACAPGVGVDCAGLVLQALYATGMDMSPMNPWDHFYTPGHNHYAVWMAQSNRFKHVSFSERQRGDLIFYSGHVAIYLGNDVILEANVPRVRTSNVYAPGAIIGVARPYI